MALIKSFNNLLTIVYQELALCSNWVNDQVTVI